MKSLPPSLFLFPFLFLSAVTTLRAEDFEMNGHGTMSLSVPKGWKAKGEATAQALKGETGYTIKLTPPEDVNAGALITCLHAKQGAPTKEGVEEFLRKNCERFLKGSVETGITPHAFAVRQGFGAYSFFTDVKRMGQPVKKGDMKIMASGIIQPNEDLIVVVTLLTDDAEGADFTAMLQAINSLMFAKAPKGPTI